MSAAPAPLRVLGLRARRRAHAAGDAAARPAVSFRLATRGDVDAIHALIEAHLSEGHLLPRSRADVAHHVGRFVVATQAGRLVACADLAPIGPTVVELRSLVVDASARSAGVATRLIDMLARRAAADGRHTMCAFTHAPQYFVEKGFSVVPHSQVPEKVEADCRRCPQFGHCGQSAVTLPLPGNDRSKATQQVLPVHG